MQTVSLCMIVKNEEDTLERCLLSVKDLVDEIVVVDTGSSDRTKEIARKYTDKILDFDWVNDFSKARNFSFRKATMDYILWLDADDVLLPEDQPKFQSLKASLDPSVDYVMMQYNTGFDTKGNTVFHYFRERLVNRLRHFQWKEPVHEYLKVSGKMIQSDVCVTHTKTNTVPSKRNLAIYEHLLAQDEQLSIRGLYYYARELKDNGYYAKAIPAFVQFLDTGKGWIEDNIAACAELAACYEQEHLPEKQHLALLRSFLYDTPRAEICCALGYLYIAKEDYKRAIFWFRLAISLQKPENCWGFLQEDYWGYIPCMELAVCYDRLGNVPLAEMYNELAGKCKPDDPSVAYNRRYFQSLKQ